MKTLNHSYFQTNVALCCEFVLYFHATILKPILKTINFYFDHLYFIMDNYRQFCLKEKMNPTHPTIALKLNMTRNDFLS